MTTKNVHFEEAYIRPSPASAIDALTITNSMSLKMAIQFAQLRQMLSTNNAALITSILLASILTYIQREVIDHAVIFTWLSLIVIIAFSRVALVFSYKRSVMGNADTHVRLVRFRLGVLISGVVWGIGGFLLFPENHPQYQLFLIFMLAGLSVGGVVSYSADRVSGIAYPISVLVPIVIRLFIEEDRLHVAMGMAVMLYLAFIIISSRQINRNTLENIILRLEAVEREEAVRLSEHRWKSALEGAGDGVWDYDFQTNKNTISNGLKGMLGFYMSSHGVDDQPNDWLDRLHPDCLSETEKAFQAVVDNKTDNYAVEQQVRCEDGSYKWMLTRGRVLSRTDDGKPIRMVGIGSDLTERKQAEQQLRIAATAFESQEGMIVTDANYAILRVNQAFTNITGYTNKDVIGLTPLMLSSERQDDDFYTAKWEAINRTGVWEGEIWSRRKCGEVYPEYLTITAVKDSNGNVTNYVSTLMDITLRKAAEERIQYLAFYDPLTHLPNRRLLKDRLNQAMVLSERSGTDGALLFIDLDHFKSLNDTLGHAVGDLLLQQVAERLTNCVREGDTVARLGGDEFVILLEGLSEHPIEAAAQTESIGKKVITSLNQPYQLGTHEHQSTPSIGVALFSDHDQSREDLLKHADIAMYQAKKAGRNRLSFFDGHMQDAINTRVDMERELRNALNKQQFQLHYQVQVDSAGKALGAEALIRWHHPERGIISPFHFIPLAEETGLILPIGQWVLETACAQIKQWQQEDLTHNLVLAVNVSAKQFLQIDFVETVQSTIQHHGIDPTRLKLELTESILLDNIEYIITTMNALKAIGILFSLDDFGTGYSSLQYLKTLPLNQLKIDQSFVRDIATDSQDKAIVRTIIAMAQSLDLSVIAEGVETAEQRQLLFDKGCKHYQGYLFSKPVPIDEFEVLLRKG